MKIVAFFYDRMYGYENYALLEVVRETKTLWITEKRRIRKDSGFMIYEAEKHLEKIKLIISREKLYKVLDDLQEVTNIAKYEVLKGNQEDNFKKVLEICQKILDMK